MGDFIRRRNLIEKLVPEGNIVSRKWLMDQTGLNHHAIDNLVKSQQLKLLYKGLYTRGENRPSWQSIVYTLQHILRTDFIIGGIYALELKGFLHYISKSNKVEIHIYGNDKLPNWVNELAVNVVFVKHSRTSLFSDMDRDLIAIEKLKNVLF